MDQCKVALNRIDKDVVTQKNLKSLGPIDRKFHGHGENDRFVLYEYIIKQFISFCKHTNISDLKKNCQIN